MGAEIVPSFLLHIYFNIFFISFQMTFISGAGGAGGRDVGRRGFFALRSNYVRTKVDKLMAMDANFPARNLESVGGQKKTPDRGRGSFPV